MAVTLSASDGTGVGVAHTWVSIDGGQVREYSGPLTISREGASTIEYWSDDQASPANVEVKQSVTVRVDTQAPVISLNVLASYDDTANVSANGEDPVSGVDSSAWSWSLDGGAWQAGDRAVVSSAGEHSVAFRARDAAGNEKTDSATFVVTKASTVVLSGAPTSIGWNAFASIAGHVMGRPDGIGYRPAEVVLESRAANSGPWSRVATATLDPLRRFALAFKPARRVFYRVRFAGDRILRSGETTPVAIAPRVAITSPVVVATSRAANPVFGISGTIMPRHASGVWIRAERRRSNGTWMAPVLVRASLASNGRGGSTYRASVRLARGQWRIRAYHPLDALHATTYSTVRTVNVR